MSKQEQTKPIYLIHPFLFSLYPVLFLWVDNIDQTPFFAILRSLIISVVFALIIYGLASLIFRNFRKSAVAASAIIISFLSYGHVYNFIENNPTLNTYIGYYRLLAIFLILLAACFVVVWKLKGDLKSLNQALLVISVLLLVLTVGQSIIFYYKGLPIYEFSTAKNVEEETIVVNNEFPERDIYYIILDSYSREDLLKSEYDYDNSSFLHELEQLGFVIPDCTLSNYDNTVFSMVSSLNMNYLPELPIKIDETSSSVDIQGISPYIRNSLVREKFELLGYQTVTFKTVYPFLEIKDSDIYYDVEQSADVFDKLETENFQHLFFNTTILRIIIEVLEAPPDYLFNEDATPVQVYLAQILTPQKKLFSTRHFKWYDQHLFAFERLEEIPEIPGNKFIYAHLFTTHQPFVFTTTGQVRWPIVESDNAYLDQVTYTNNRMLEIIQTIIDKSTNPPIIVIQGDHSYSKGDNRHKILNAYYLPEDGNKEVTPDFSPVNTFRLIFNTYFGEKHEILPNRAYRSQEGAPYQFNILPLDCVNDSD
jgi:hypothetical protein